MRLREVYLEPNGTSSMEPILKNCQRVLFIFIEICKDICAVNTDPGPTLSHIQSWHWKHQHNAGSSHLGVLIVKSEH